MTSETIAPSTCIVRNTAARKGRTLAVKPGATATRYLHYGRIILDARDGPVTFDTGDQEDGLICLGGGGTVTVDGAAHVLGLYDAIYVPRDSAVTVTPGAGGLRLRRGGRAGGTPASGAGGPLQRREAEPGPALRDRRRVGEARAERAHRQERRGRPDHGGRHLQRARQLDVVAAARARGDARGGLPLHRHARPVVRRAAGLHRTRRTPSSPSSCARATWC